MLLYSASLRGVRHFVPRLRAQPVEQLNTYSVLFAPYRFARLNNRSAVQIKLS